MGYVATKSRPRYLDTDLKAEFAGDNPDYFDVKTNKWYSTSGGVSIGATLIIGSEITPRNYLNNIVYADHNGQPEYVEEGAKVEYKDVIKAKEYRGKNACTAWANFDGTTTPPTIRDSFNVSAVIRTSTGQYDIYFSTNMDNSNYSYAISSFGTIQSGTKSATDYNTQSKIGVETSNASGTLTNYNNVSLQIFGGKN